MTNSWTYLKTRCEEWERRQRRVHAFLAADSENPKLKIRTMLSTVATKVGPSKEVLAWSLPLAKTCCVDDVHGESIASPVCRAVCYVHRMTADRPNVNIKALRNFAIACRDDFSVIMIGAIHHAGVKDFKIHVAGEFFSQEYIDSWSEVVRDCPEVSFFTYTRSWRRPEFLPALQRLAGISNIQVWLSCDQSTGQPPSIPETRVAYLSTHDEDIPSFACDLAFRSTLERLTLPLPILGSVPVCPHQNGKPNSPPDCVTCRICLPPADTTRSRRIA